MFNFRKKKTWYILKPEKDITAYELAILFGTGAKIIPEKAYAMIENTSLARHFRKVAK